MKKIDPSAKHSAPQRRMAEDISVQEYEGEGPME